MRHYSKDNAEKIQTHQNKEQYILILMTLHIQFQWGRLNRLFPEMKNKTKTKQNNNSHNNETKQNKNKVKRRETLFWNSQNLQCTKS